MRLLDFICTFLSMVTLIIAIAAYGFAYNRGYERGRADQTAWYLDGLEIWCKAADAAIPDKLERTKMPYSLEHPHHH